MKFNTNLGLAFRAMRKKRALTLADLSAATGASASNLSKIETGGAQGASFDLLLAMAQSLGVKLHEVVSQAEGVDTTAMDSLSPSERLLITQYRAVTASDKKTVEIVLGALTARNHC